MFTFYELVLMLVPGLEAYLKRDAELSKEEISYWISSHPMDALDLVKHHSQTYWSDETFGGTRFVRNLAGRNLCSISDGGTLRLFSPLGEGEEKYNSQLMAETGLHGHLKKKGWSIPVSKT